MPFEKGKSGNPGGRPRMSPEVREAFERMTPRAVAVLEELLGSKDDEVRFRASQAILDRQLGKPAQPVEHSDPEGNALSLSVRLIKPDGSSS